MYIHSDSHNAYLERIRGKHAYQVMCRTTLQPKRGYARLIATEEELKLLIEGENNDIFSILRTYFLKGQKTVVTA